MNELERFEQLALRARGEIAPSLDVTAPVLSDIHRRTASSGWRSPLLVVSGLSLAAASIVAILSIQCWAVLSDPLAGLFDSLMMVMQ